MYTHTYNITVQYGQLSEFHDSSSAIAIVNHDSSSRSSSNNDNNNNEMTLPRHVYIMR